MKTTTKRHRWPTKQEREEFAAQLQQYDNANLSEFGLRSLLLDTMHTARGKRMVMELVLELLELHNRPRPALRVVRS